MARAFALAVMMIAAPGIAWAQVEMRADPMTFCAAKLPPDCAATLSAGSIATADRSAECRDALDAYSGCLSLVASECGPAGLGTTPSLSAPGAFAPGSALGEPLTLRCAVTGADAPYAIEADKLRGIRDRFPSPIELTIDPGEFMQNLYIWGVDITGDAFMVGNDVTGRGYNDELQFGLIVSHKDGAMTLNVSVFNYAYATLTGACEKAKLRPIDQKKLF